MLTSMPSLRVHSRHQLFGWSQVMLQSLVKHELLVCALRSPTRRAIRLIASRARGSDTEKVSEVFRRDAAFVADLVSEWVEAEFHPVVCSAGRGVPLARGAFTAELQRLGAESVIAHAPTIRSASPSACLSWPQCPATSAASKPFSSN